MDAMKARLRAWLIDLAREAIRIEFPMPPIVPNYEKPTRAVTSVPQQHPEFPGITRAADQSFEQLQEEALKAQEKYYEPERA